MNYGDLQIYHIFTLGFCGAEGEYYQNGEVQHRLDKIAELVDYLREMEINTLLLGPLFSSLSHGYDTTDYYTVDRRLGDNEDLMQLVEIMHKNDIRVVLDCVFNHVGRDFFAFRDLLANRENSPYRDWFVNVNFNWNNGHGDGFCYDTWAGHEALVKLNLSNYEVRGYLLEVMEFWLETFGIDGVRMDAANVMDRGFLRDLVRFTKDKNPDFVFIGESVHGDYGELVREGGLDAVTNYEGYKGMYSSLNDRNYFEIAYSLNRLFGAGGMYKDFYTANFVDNHDVNRVASTLTDERLLEPLYLMLYTMPGFPNVYCGSEQGLKGVKGDHTDAPLRPPYEAIHFDLSSDLYRKLARLGKVRRVLPALRHHSYVELVVASQQLAYERSNEDERAVVVFNAEDHPVTIAHGSFQGRYYDAYHDVYLELAGEVEVPAFSGRILVAEDALSVAQLEALNEGTTGESSAAAAMEEASQTDVEATVDASLQGFMQLALDEARQGFAEGEVPIGAVLVKDGEVIARDHNRKEGLQDPTAHAEILVLRAGAEKLQSWRLSGCTLFVTAEPCPMCMGAIIQARLGKLVYATYEPRFGAVETTAELGKHPMLPKDIEIYSGICEAEAQELLKAFFENQR